MHSTEWVRLRARYKKKKRNVGREAEREGKKEERDLSLIGGHQDADTNNNIVRGPQTAQRGGAHAGEEGALCDLPT